MALLYLLLVANGITELLSQACRQLQLHKTAYSQRYLAEKQISCLYDLSLEQCALECLLVKTCKSFNHVKRIFKTKHGMMCELNSENHSQAYYSHFVDMNYQRNFNYVYVDIEDWPKEVAGTCAHRPCAENQRCVQTTPYRCIDIDCGAPPVSGEIQAMPTGTSHGSKARYQCRNHGDATVPPTQADFQCQLFNYQLCNSDSTWTDNLLRC